MEFLKPKENDESKNHCKCYKFLTIALLTLNEQVLRHKNYESDKNFYNLRKITKSAVINIANLLSLTRKTVGFWNFNFCHNMMDDVSLKIKFDKVAVGDEVFKYKDVMLPGKSHDTFLKKLKVKTTIQDDDLSFLNLSQQEIDLNNTIKERNENLRKNLINETVQFLKEE
ncbi:hypothetical protein PVAND_016420 [Polypedilum vanderplanki]|uniref:Uncharacterized protein n=1 Tax=Polypedilum vanderplanki TaxID=319348 RepID=A0A9J6BF20_POLVA|nr:hypothetical protein PVAND_016420 [Polypedilum vanderplanki]